jgi:hydrogenase maturation protein HypF
LPGGEAAVREPRRSALGVLFELGGAEALDDEELPPVAAFTPKERRVLARMLSRGLSAPRTTSAGRLFDAAAALAGVRQAATFEGQAAMEFECAAGEVPDGPGYPFPLIEGEEALVVDWGPAVGALIVDRRAGVPLAQVAARFHAGLADAIVAVALRAGEPKVALSGGCFQNRVLLTAAIRRLRAAGFTPLWHQRVPPNDGGLALGQALAAAAILREAAPCA